MRDLVHQRWATASFWLLNIALPLVAVCALLGWVIPMQLAAAALGAGLILGAANVVGVIVPRKVGAQG
jgi:ABC-type multidrug transport system permease subunit